MFRHAAPRDRLATPGIRTRDLLLWAALRKMSLQFPHFPLPAATRPSFHARIASPGLLATCSQLALSPFCVQREWFIDNLLVRIHYIIVMIRWTGPARWECEFPFPGSLTSTFCVQVAAIRLSHLCLSLAHTLYISHSFAWSLSLSLSPSLPLSLPPSLSLARAVTWGGTSFIAAIRLSHRPQWLHACTHPPFCALCRSVLVARPPRRRAGDSRAGAEPHLTSGRWTERLLNTNGVQQMERFIDFGGGDRNWNIIRRDVNRSSHHGLILPPGSSRPRGLTDMVIKRAALLVDLQPRRHAPVGMNASQAQQDERKEEDDCWGHGRFGACTPELFSFESIPLDFLVKLVKIANWSK